MQAPTGQRLAVRNLRQGRTGLAAGLHGIPEATVAGPAELALGSVQLALMSGVLVQWLIDPGRAPDERMIADGILGLAAHSTGTPGPGAS